MQGNWNINLDPWNKLFKTLKIWNMHFWRIFVFCIPQLFCILFNFNVRLMSLNNGWRFNFCPFERDWMNTFRIYFFKKTRKMFEKFCCIFYCEHFENTFLELITNLALMQNPKKKDPNKKACSPPPPLKFWIIWGKCAHSPF